MIGETFVKRLAYPFVGGGVIVGLLASIVESRGLTEMSEIVRENWDKEPRNPEYMAEYPQLMELNQAIQIDLPYQDTIREYIMLFMIEAFENVTDPIALFTYNIFVGLPRIILSSLAVILIGLTIYYQFKRIPNEPPE